MTRSKSIKQSKHDSSNACDTDKLEKTISKRKPPCAECNGRTEHQIKCSSYKRVKHKERRKINPDDKREFVCPVCAEKNIIKDYLSESALYTHMNSDKCSMKTPRKGGSDNSSVQEEEEMDKQIKKKHQCKDCYKFLSDLNRHHCGKPKKEQKKMKNNNNNKAIKHTSNQNPNEKSIRKTQPNFSLQDFKENNPEKENDMKQMIQEGMKFCQIVQKYAQFLGANQKWFVDQYKAQTPLTDEEMNSIENISQYNAEEIKEVQVLSKFWRQEKKIQLSKEILQKLAFKNN